MLESKGLNLSLLSLCPNTLIRHQKKSLSIQSNDIAEVMELRYQRVGFGRSLCQDMPEDLRLELAGLGVDTKFISDLYYMTLGDPRGDLEHETVYFLHKEAFERWRKLVMGMQVLSTNFLQKYIMQTELGRSGYSTFHCISKASNNKKYIAVAFHAKLLDELLHPGGAVRNQVNVYRLVGNNVHFPKLREVHLTKIHLFLVLDYFEGTTLSQLYAEKILTGKIDSFDLLYPILR